jgi:hypothetical protein
MTDASISPPVKLYIKMCGDGKEIKGLPTCNVVYGYTFFNPFLN